ncbi:MAG: hypothetical protein RIQ45_1028 [Actinomycetota bacterium]|jgi:hypothetical protein
MLGRIITLDPRVLRLRVIEGANRLKSMRNTLNLPQMSVVLCVVRGNLLSERRGVHPGVSIGDGTYGRDI